MGVAINDAIVVAAAIREDEHARKGDPQAVADVVVRSPRHVLATTVTTIVGFLSLILSGGGFWPPMAVAIAGGVTGATILALCFVPSAYVLVMCPKCAASPASDTNPTRQRGRMHINGAPSVHRSDKFMARQRVSSLKSQVSSLRTQDSGLRSQTLHTPSSENGATKIDIVGMIGSLAIIMMIVDVAGRWLDGRYLSSL